MDQSEAAETLEAVTRVRAETRRRLASSWYARIVIGIFLVGAGALNAVEAGEAVAWVYWVGGLALGGWLIVAHYARTELEAGIESRPWDASTALLLLMAVVLVAVNRITEGSDTGVAVCLVAAAFTLGFAWLSRDPVEALSAIPMAGLAAAFALADPSEPGTLINAGIGVILIAAALITRARERAAAPRHGARPARA